jgi:hypothetical protein
MSCYVLRGTSGPGDEPNDEDPLSHFSTDMRWEIGYDQRWFTFYALLLDEDADGEASPVFEVGSGPCECPTVEALNRELDAMAMWVSPAVATGLRNAQLRHLAGHMGGPRVEVDQRRRTARRAAFVEFVTNWIRPTIRPPG